jgi:hypothetical protein
MTHYIWKKPTPAVPAVMHRLDLKLAKIAAESSGHVKQSSSPPLMVQFHMHQCLNHP